MESSAACKRIVDANLNRAKEAFRVAEDIIRFEYNDANLSTLLKSLRLEVGSIAKKYYDTIAFRDTQNDCLTKVTLEKEKKRISLFEILIINFKRAQESLRVLEEVFKLLDIENSALCKQIRYKTYILEKEIYDKYAKH
ncbi:MAG: thiamine-phosphate pyrophosphorylase [Desulfurella sp.]|uniref:thiamine-phosphate pyrophosphorylase n=1 Tax=Desulfurella sp. TaxID=1962857 RepID=UPI003C9BA276